MSVFDKSQNGQQPQADDGEDDILGQISKAAGEIGSGGSRHPLLYTAGLGDGFVLIRRVGKFRKRLGKALTYSAELTVLEWTPAKPDNLKSELGDLENADTWVAEQGKRGAQAGPGSTWALLEGTDVDGFDKRLAAFFCRSMGSTAEELTPAAIRMLTGEEQPMAGMIVGVQNVFGRGLNKKTKQYEINISGKGDPYVNTMWRTASQRDVQRLSVTATSIDPAWQVCPLQPGAQPQAAAQ